MFIGWVPGTDPQYEAARATPAAPPATIAPPTPPPGPSREVCEPEMPPDQQVCALPEPDGPTPAEREARDLVGAP